MFAQGDLVVYGGEGVCRVEGVGTPAAMGIDKAKARAGKWRIAEGTLFALAALGGALGGTLGMRVFHHKTKHKEFRFGFPALLCLQCAAVVYLILIWKQVL